MSVYEIRVFLIGDYQVGKKSIVQRFKKLNSTGTEDDNFFVPEDLKLEYEKELKKTEKQNEKFDKDNKLERIEKGMIRKQIERKNLMKFKKIFIVEHSKFEFNFFPITPAEKLSNTNPNDMAKEEDEDYEFEQTYRISLKKVKKEIEKILLKGAKNPQATVENLFLFIYDLQDYNTFEKIEIYFSQLDKYFQIQNNYYKALIGNKADIRVPFKQEEKINFDKFISNNDFKHYEISTFNYFNFEKFFEQLFKEVLITMDEELQQQTFLNRFHLILNTRSTLSKAERKIHEKNDVPFLNNDENPDVYAYPENEKEFRRTFSNTKGGRFGFKIFINKQGPSFPAIDKQNEKNKQNQFSKPTTAFSRDKKSKTAIGFGNWEASNKNKEIREALQTNIPGYSLGIRRGKYGFVKERKKRFEEREMELKSAFAAQDLNLHVKKDPSFKSKKIFEQYYDNKKEYMKDLTDDIIKKENKYLTQRLENIKQQEELREEKVKKIKEKQEKYQKKFEETQKEMQMTKTGLYHPKTAISRKDRQKGRTPNPTLYDIRTKYDSNKGWTFGMKYKHDDNKNKDDPEFPNLPSDFDKIVKYPKYAEIKYTAPRFKEEKIYQPSIEIIYDNDKIEKTKNKGERKINLETFLEERRQKKEKVLENKKLHEEELKEDLEELKFKIASKNKDENQNPDLIDINYKLVEDSAPNYTMKGRYTHGSIFDMPDNYSAVNNDDDDEENKLGSNGKPIQDENYKTSLPVPQYNVVKPSLPTFSFNKAKRFNDKPLYQPSPNVIPVMPFENGKFMPDDTKTFSCIQGGMGKAKKNTTLKGNGVPGPYYEIKGFADIIVQKGKIISDVRAKIIKEKRKLENNKNEKMEKKKVIHKEKSNEERDEEDESHIDNNDVKEGKKQDGQMILNLED